MENAHKFVLFRIINTLHTNFLRCNRCTALNYKNSEIFSKARGAAMLLFVRRPLRPTVIFCLLEKIQVPTTSE